MGRQTLASMANKSLFFGAIGGAFAAGRCNAVVFRETEDWYNDVAGSLAAGAIVGIKKRSILAVFAYGGVLAGAIGMARITGANFNLQQEPSPRLNSKLQRLSKTKENYTIETTMVD